MWIKSNSFTSKTLPFFPLNGKLAGLYPEPLSEVKTAKRISFVRHSSSFPIQTLKARYVIIIILINIMVKLFTYERVFVKTICLQCLDNPSNALIDCAYLQIVLKIVLTFRLCQKLYSTIYIQTSYYVENTKLKVPNNSVI